jgi:hypothetical protein
MSLTFDFAGAAELTIFFLKNRIGQPHQFRPRKDVNETIQARSKSDEKAGKSAAPIDMLPLITV